MNMDMNTIKGMRIFLVEMGKREEKRLWRLARKAKEHGVSNNVIREIRLEACDIRDTAEAHPEKFLDDWYLAFLTYAFKLGGVRA